MISLGLLTDRGIARAHAFVGGGVRFFGREGKNSLCALTRPTLVGARNGVVDKLTVPPSLNTMGEDRTTTRHGQIAATKRSPHYITNGAGQYGFIVVM